MDCDSLILKLPSYFLSCKILDLAVTQTKNNLKSWFNVYFDKYCHKSIQKFKTVTENKRNFLFEFRAIFSFCSADILFFTPHLSLETLETKTQPTHNIPSFQWTTGKQFSSKTVSVRPTIVFERIRRSWLPPATRILSSANHRAALMELAFQSILSIYSSLHSLACVTDARGRKNQALSIASVDQWQIPCVF